MRARAISRRFRRDNCLSPLTSRMRISRFRAKGRSHRASSIFTAKMSSRIARINFSACCNRIATGLVDKNIYLIFSRFYLGKDDNRPNENSPQESSSLVPTTEFSFIQFLFSSGQGQCSHTDGAVFFVFFFVFRAVTDTPKENLGPRNSIWTGRKFGVSKLV